MEMIEKHRKWKLNEGWGNIILILITILFNFTSYFVNYLWIDLFGKYLTNVITSEFAGELEAFAAPPPSLHGIGHLSNQSILPKKSISF